MSGNTLLFHSQQEQQPLHEQQQRTSAEAATQFIANLHADTQVSVCTPPGSPMRQEDSSQSDSTSSMDYNYDAPSSTKHPVASKSQTKYKLSDADYALEDDMYCDAATLQHRAALCLLQLQHKTTSRVEKPHLCRNARPSANPVARIVQLAYLDTAAKTGLLNKSTHTAFKAYRGSIELQIADERKSKAQRARTKRRHDDTEADAAEIQDAMDKQIDLVSSHLLHDSLLKTKTKKTRSKSKKAQQVQQPQKQEEPSLATQLGYQVKRVGGFKLCISKLPTALSS